MLGVTKRALQDQAWAFENPESNALLYYQLANATVGTTVHYRVSKFKAAKDRNGAWTSLSTWHNALSQKRVICEQGKK